MRVTTVNSIELSSRCNYSCEYCPAKDQGKHRKTGLMPMETFKKAIEFIKYFSDKGTQKEVNLFGVGESLLNPDLIEMVKIARENLSAAMPVHLNTNGGLMTEKIANDLDNYLDQLDITAHKARDAITAYQICRGHKYKLGMSIDFLTQYNDWAGQVDWFKSEQKYECPWLRDGQAFIMSDGNISTCCFDAFARGIIGNVFDSDPSELTVQPFKLCETCHQLHE